MVTGPTISVFAPDGRLRGWLQAPESLRVTPRHLEVGEATIGVQMLDPRAGWLREPGARVRIERGGHHVLGGPVTAIEATGPRPGGWTFTIKDDKGILDRIITMPDPSKPLDQQPAGAAVRAGKLESVVKQFVGENAPRLGVPIDISADKGRGPNVTLSGRFQPISDVIGASLRAAGMGVSVVWQPSTGRLLLDVTEGREYPVQLSVQSRTVRDYKLSMSAPTATRVYLGAAEGTSFTVSTNTADETEYGPHLRGEKFATAGNADEMTTTATETLNDGASKSGISVTLAETDYVFYGGADGINVGDKVSLVVGDVTVTDIVREVILDWSTTGGLTITPGIGAWDNSPVRSLARAVSRMAATIRRDAARQ